MKGAFKMNAITEIGKFAVTETILDMDALFIRWVSYLDAAPKTIDTYRKAMKQFVLWVADKGIDKPVRADIIAYRDELKENHKPATVQLYMGAVKLFFRWTEQEHIYPNIADHVKGAKIDTEHKKDPLTSAQAKRLMESIDRNTLKGKSDYALLAVMITTGLRTISISCANVGDMRPLGDCMGLYYKGKGHDEKSVSVKISPVVESAIRDYLNCRKAVNSDAPLFCSISNRNGGERMTTKSISRIVKEHLTDVGLISDRLTAHSMRHTAATLNLLNGGTLEETCQMLDHSNINTTRIYVHALERANNNSELRVSGAIFGW